MIRISEAVTALLDLVQFRLGVSIEVLDPSLQPVQPALQGEFAGTIDEPGVRAQCQAVLRSGESRIERGLPAPLAMYPVRIGREITGLVIVTRGAGRVAPRQSEADEVEHLQTVGLMTRAILENDLSRTRHLARESERIRRLQGILRFIGQLHALRRGPEMMQAVVQAATVWFDLDCRIYRRAADGGYALLAALPGADAPEVRPHLDGARLREMCAARRVSSMADLDFLGGPARRGTALVLGAGLDEDVVLVLLGAIDGEVELTFTAIAQAVGGELQIAAGGRLGHWQGRLSERASALAEAPERVLLELIEELCVAVGAAGGRVSFKRGDEQRTLAALDASGEAGERLMRADPARSHQRILSVGGGLELHLELWGRAAPFDLEPLTEVDGWVAVLQPWMAGSGILRTDVLAEAGGAEEVAFERMVHQEVERAKRFNLGLALVLIDNGGTLPPDALADVVRTQLRASDLCGPVRGGRMAVVLVHSGPEAAQSVIRRIGENVAALLNGTQRAAVRLGQAVFSSECRSGDALISEALQRLEDAPHER
ncbi:MAG: hypothetical protein H0X67_14660 [Acidobacteria bacterium]|nr:hypothetical protein [Acidobacteriota bacterium]